MNAQLRELVRQAGLDDPDFPIEDWDNVPLAKFAQLIVRECVTICQYNADDDDDQFDLGRVHQAKEITHLIKKHFGVEE